MMFYLLCKPSLLIIILHAVPHTDGSTILEVRQPKHVTAKVGESVNIICSFTHHSASFFAKWTRGCNHSMPLTDQTCYNGRISNADADTTSVTTNTGTPCCERYATMTIANVTENDSGIYCCHIQTGNVKKGTGSGTRLEVTPRTNQADTNQDDMKTYVLYAVIGAEACIILVLLIVGVKYRLRGSSQFENQVFEEKLEHESRLHYAEICQFSESKREKDKRPVERVTYAPVKMRQ